MKQTQNDKVREILEKEGKISNFQAIRKHIPKKQNKPTREEQLTTTLETIDFVRHIINESRSIAMEIVRNKGMKIRTEKKKNKDTVYVLEAEMPVSRLYSGITRRTANELLKFENAQYGTR